VKHLIAYTAVLSETLIDRTTLQYLIKYLIALYCSTLVKHLVDYIAVHSEILDSASDSHLHVDFSAEIILQLQLHCSTQ